MCNQDFKYTVQVVFKDNQRSYTFGSNENNFDVDEKVVVETSKGIELAKVVESSKENDGSNKELKPVLRKASNEDLKAYNDNLEKANKALDICRKEVSKLNLDMQLLEAEYTLDCKKVTFVYVADERVDFRELLKVLASFLHCRIELRQVGPRNKAKMVGGIGQCGQQMCCNRFLNDFEMISINMAKNQLLALNIQKLSGQCGKLKCCLRYEDELYKELRKDLPKINTKLEYNSKNYRLTGLNVISEEAKIENKEEVLFVPFIELWPELYEKKENKDE